MREEGGEGGGGRDGEKEGGCGDSSIDSHIILEVESIKTSNSVLDLPKLLLPLSLYVFPLWGKTRVLRKMGF